jgi:hypothetical protein
VAGAEELEAQGPCRLVTVAERIAVGEAQARKVQGVAKGGNALEGIIAQALQPAHAAPRGGLHRGPQEAEATIKVRELTGNALEGRYGSVHDLRPAHRESRSTPREEDRLPEGAGEGHSERRGQETSLPTKELSRAGFPSRQERFELVRGNMRLQLRAAPPSNHHL